MRNLPFSYSFLCSSYLLGTLIFVLKLLVRNGALCSRACLLILFRLLRVRHWISPSQAIGAAEHAVDRDDHSNGSDLVGLSSQATAAITVGAILICLLVAVVVGVVLHRRRAKALGRSTNFEWDEAVSL